MERAGQLGLNVETFQSNHEGELIDTQELEVQIEIDGGVNLETIGSIAEAGADVFVAGSAIFGSEDYKKTISSFKEIING